MDLAESSCADAFGKVGYTQVKSVQGGLGEPGGQAARIAPGRRAVTGSLPALGPVVRGSAVCLVAFR